jgi:hypothetical protein
LPIDEWSDAISAALLPKAQRESPEIRILSISDDVQLRIGNRCGDFR